MPHYSRDLGTALDHIRRLERELEQERQSSARARHGAAQERQGADVAHESSAAAWGVANRPVERRATRDDRS